MVGIEDSKRVLEGLPNKINDKLGIIASINIHKAYGTENLRYGDSVPEDISSKLINKYACGLINTGMLDSSDRSYKSLAAIERDNKICETEDGIREYISIGIIKYPFAVSCDGKYYKRSDSTLQELNGFE